MSFPVNTFCKRIAIATALMLLSACDAVPNEPVAETARKSTQGVQGQLIAGILAAEVGPDTVQMDELLFYLQNNTAETAQLLPWNTPLEQFLSADLFLVSTNDERLPYTGRVIKRQAPQADDYINLEAGERLESVVVLSQGYDLSRSGEYRIVLESLSLQDSSGELEVVIVDDTVLLTIQ